MEDLDIRLAQLNPVTRQRIKDLTLSSGDDDLMMCISLGENTSAKIAVFTGAAVQSVSGRLSKLRAKGYLAREEIPQDSGGYEYMYKNLFDIDKAMAGE